MDYSGDILFVFVRLRRFSMSQGLILRSVVVDHIDTMTLVESMCWGDAINVDGMLYLILEYCQDVVTYCYELVRT